MNMSSILLFIYLFVEGQNTYKVFILYKEVKFIIKSINKTSIDNVDIIQNLMVIVFLKLLQ